MKKSSRKGFIYFRYLLPIGAALIMLLLMLVPCYSYITADDGIKEAMSLGELIANSWNTSREYLFGGGEKYEATLGFSRALLAITVGLVLLFATGLAAAVYSAVSVLKYIRGGGHESKSRLVFVTVFPNRIVLCAAYALTLPIFFLPRIMPMLYKSFLSYHVELNTSPFDIALAAIALYIGCIAVSAVSKNIERSEQMNIFAHKRVDSDEDIANEAVCTAEDKGQNETNDPYELMSAREKAEQLERILRMLDSYEADKEEKKEDGR